jgi:hypothetical protein
MIDLLQAPSQVTARLSIETRFTTGMHQRDPIDHRIPTHWTLGAPVPQPSVLFIAGEGVSEAEGN